MSNSRMTVGDLPHPLAASRPLLTYAGHGGRSSQGWCFPNRLPSRAASRRRPARETMCPLPDVYGRTAESIFSFPRAPLTRISRAPSLSTISMRPSSWVEPRPV